MTRASVSDDLPDAVCITGLSLVTIIGVPEKERALPQTVEADIRLEPASGTLSRTNDRLDRTIDYHAVSQTARRLASSGERRLIEKLAEDIAVAIISEFPVRRATIEIRKFILPGTKSVSVRVTRRKEETSD